MTWHPILVGDSADAARRIAREIGEHLVAACAHDGPIDPRESIVDRGDGGLALAYAYLHRAGLADSADPAVAFLERALAAIAEHEMDHSLLRGFTGIGWVANHLIASENDDDDPAAAIDEGVLAVLESGPVLHFDLIQGLVGLGTYALSRLPRASALHMLVMIVDRLAASSVRLPAGIAWFTGPGDPGADTAGFPGGSYSLGFARGVPGVTALLAACVRRSIAMPLARELLDGSVAWVLAQRVDDPRGQYPIHVDPAGVHAAAFARPAWCFGDVGVAMGLSIAARATGDATWTRAAIEAARASAKTTLTREIADGAFCHGSVGLAHMLARIAASTGDDEVRRGAVSWFEHALANRRPDLGFGGFPTATHAGVLDDSGRAGWSLMFGAAGVALCLASAASDTTPDWDQLILVDPPS